MEEPVVYHRCLLGEGPVWDAMRRTICWIDILQGEIHEYSPVNDMLKTLSVNQMIGSIAICKRGSFIAALQNGIGFIDRDTGAVQMISNPEAHLPGNRFNDGKCDPEGRFWAGTMSHTDEPGKGSLYLLNKDLSIIKKLEKISISNGMAWSLDHKTFYYIDSPAFTVVAFDFDQATGEISNPKIIIQIAQKEGCPDGMTIDSEGMLWIAHWDGWQITRWDPVTGKKILAIHLPVARVTSCCFGGDGLGDLYITSARTGLDDDQLKKQPLAGSLFVIKNTGYCGLPAFEFNG
ncbi:MAG TPA: SMP-30/gluconolaconase/LRE domain protein [Chitinophagaceae bacterium]|nr:SMP-30/gluconolaconase/LRE domain protein [Chitinophagaceae bacterium]